MVHFCRRTITVTRLRPLWVLYLPFLYITTLTRAVPAGYCWNVPRNCSVVVYACQSLPIRATHDDGAMNATLQCYHCCTTTVELDMVSYHVLICQSPVHPPFHCTRPLVIQLLMLILWREYNMHGLSLTVIDSDANPWSLYAEKKLSQYPLANVLLTNVPGVDSVAGARKRQLL